MAGEGVREGVRRAALYTEEDVERVFEQLDLDKNELLDYSEVKVALDTLHIRATEAELQALFGLLHGMRWKEEGKEERNGVEMKNNYRAGGVHPAVGEKRSRGEGSSRKREEEAEEAGEAEVEQHADYRPITYLQFRAFVSSREKELLEVFHAIDGNANGLLEEVEVDKALRTLGLDSSQDKVSAMIEEIDCNDDGMVDFTEFKRLTLLMPSAKVEDVFTVWGARADALDLGETSGTGLHGNVLSWQGKVLIAGGVAGAVSRTCTAPFDRLKVLLQAGAKVSNKPVTGILAGMRAIYAEGGARAFFRGNGTNVVKIMPESAVKFFAFEYLHKVIAKDPSNVTVPERFVAGALAGVAAQTSIYPLEVAKTRLAVAPSGTYRGLFHCLRQTASCGGLSSLYRGLLPSLIGIVPYAGVDLCIYFTLRDMWVKTHPQQEPGVLLLLGIGAGSSFCGQTIAYPLQLVRTRLQAQGTVGMPERYSGMFDCFRQVVRRKGVRGLYSGIAPNFMKAIPAISISYVVYEKMKKILGMDLV